MKSSHQHCRRRVRELGVGLLLLVTSVPAGSAFAQQATTLVTQEPAQLEERVRGLQQQARFEEAIGELGAILEITDPDPELLRAAYLLSIDSHILYGNTFYDAGRTETAELYWDRARALTREFLRHAAYRSTRPPSDTSPTLMFEIFDDVRAELFGTLRLESVEPADAEIRLDGERQNLDVEFGMLEVQDLPTGEHTLLVRSDGYEDLITEIVIEPGRIYSTSVSLEKARTWQWWTWRVGAATAVGATIYLLGTASDGTVGAEPDPLPGPPAPPGS